MKQTTSVLPSLVLFKLSLFTLGKIGLFSHDVTIADVRNGTLFWSICQNVYTTI